MADRSYGVGLLALSQFYLDKALDADGGDFFKTMSTGFLDGNYRIKVAVFNGFQDLSALRPHPDPAAAGALQSNDRCSSNIWFLNKQRPVESELSPVSAYLKRRS